MRAAAEQPLVSVIIPVYNSEKYVAEAVESVLAEQYAPLEIIAINDGSPDNAGKVLEGFGGAITVINQENRGAGAARNRGVRAAQGSILAFIDADDVWPPGHLSLLVPHITGNAPYDAAQGCTSLARNIGTPQEERQPKTHMAMLVGASVYRRKVFDTVGLFDETMRLGQDFDWYLRMIEAGCKVAVIPDVTLLQRRHAGNRTNNAEALKASQLSIIRHRLKRMRQKQAHAE